MSGKRFIIMYQFEHFTMGTCYYPEHWPEGMWPEDLARMKAAGISVVRIAEFAWTLMEPQEGLYDFSLFAHFLELCARYDMKVILCTPTATPPAWLTEKYPEVLNCREDGIPYRHGGRRHYNYNSEKYRELCAGITEAMAAHFGAHPMVIGWQIDNEINCETDEFYSEADSKAFRTWVKKKYGTIEALNESWGTIVWSQIYTDWEQIYIPRPVINEAYNPHYFLDYRRFISDSAIAFCRLQAEILHKYRKDGDFITTNGRFDLDNHRMTEECLDIFMYDSYPNFAYALDRDPRNSKDLNDRKWSRNLIETRSVCPHFGIMEQQAGAGSWVSRMEGPMPRPGQLRLWAMQSLAHGADFISFFRWRTATVGTEIYWHGILDYDSRDNRRLAEIRQFGEDMSKLNGLLGRGPSLPGGSPEGDLVKRSGSLGGDMSLSGGSPGVCGAAVRTAFALVKDYDNAWDARTDVWHRRLVDTSEPEIFAASQLAHTPYDVLYLNDETPLSSLMAWPVLIYPHPLIMTPVRAALLKEYVASGGTLILGCRSGLKDIHGHCVMLPQPGLLAELTGTDVREYTFASPAEDEPFCCWDGEIFRMPVFNDVLECRDAADTADINEAGYCESKGGSVEAGITGIVADADGEAVDISGKAGDAARFHVLAAYGSSYYAGRPAITEHYFGSGRCIHVGATFTRELVQKLFEYTNILEPFAKIAAVPVQVETVMREKDGTHYLFLLNYSDVSQICNIRRKTVALLNGNDVEDELILPPYGVEVLKL